MTILDPKAQPILSEQELTANSVTFWSTSAEVHKDNLAAIILLKQLGYWEACLWGDNVTLVKFGRI